MMKKIFGAVLVGAMIVGGAFLPAYADDGDVYNTVCDDETIDASLRKQAGCEEKRQLSSVGETLIERIIELVGLLAVGVMVFGGVQYVTSQGDSGKATSARNTILYGVIGLVLAMLAWAVVRFMTSAILG